MFHWVRVLKLNWKRPVVAVYRERNGQPERESFVVIKTIGELSLSRKEKEDTEFEGRIDAFFPLMGEVDYVSTKEGLADHYVLCWFDDEVVDFDRSMRRLVGVTFPEDIKISVGGRGKRTFSAYFKAKHAILE